MYLHLDSELEFLYKIKSVFLTYVIVSNALSEFLKKQLFFPQFIKVANLSTQFWQETRLAFLVQTYLFRICICKYLQINTFMC